MTLDIYGCLFPRHDDSEELAAAERLLLGLMPGFIWSKVLKRLILPDLAMSSIDDISKCRRRTTFSVVSER